MELDEVDSSFWPVKLFESGFQVWACRLGLIAVPSGNGGFNYVGSGGQMDLGVREAVDRSWLVGVSSDRFWWIGSRSQVDLKIVVVDLGR